MAVPSTIARPYAEAVFRLADAANALGKWGEMLSDLAGVAANERLRSAIGDPNASDAQVAGVFIGILSGRLNGEAENLVRVLAANGRLELLPEILRQYRALRNVREGVLDAEVFSAFDLTAAQVGDLVQRLERSTGRKVRARVSLDKDLIGGVKIVMGDKVIDGSARAQLGALENALKA
jgi:F-type H+-transporting ATPase subunit delta